MKWYIMSKCVPFFSILQGWGDKKELYVSMHIWMCVRIPVVQDSIQSELQIFLTGRNKNQRLIYNKWKICRFMAVLQRRASKVTQHNSTHTLGCAEIYSRP